MPAKVELDAEDQTAVDEAFDDFEPTDDEVEVALDEEEGGDAVETGEETLDDEGEEDGSATNGTDEGAEARTDTGPKGEQAKDPKTGKFLPKDGKKPEGEDPAAAAPVEKPKWEPLQVTVDRKAQAIPEAVLTRSGGHHMLAIKDADFPRFQQRLSRAVVAEQMWRGLQDAVVALEEQRAIDAEGPKSQTDKEIEAETIVDFLNAKIKLRDGTESTRMAQIVSPEEINWLADRVKVRQLEHKNKFQTDRQEFVTKRQADQAAKAAETEEPEQQIRGIGSILNRMSDANDAEFPQDVKDVFKDINETEMRAVFAAMMPIRRSLFWKEGKEWFSNTQLILETAQNAIAKARTATPGKPGTTAKPSPKVARAERLNKGSASTSLKNRRQPLTPGKGTTSAPKAERQENSHTRAQDAEKKYRDKTREYINAPGFDFGDDDEDE